MSSFDGFKEEDETLVRETGKPVKKTARKPKTIFSANQNDSSTAKDAIPDAAKLSGNRNSGKDAPEQNPDLLNNLKLEQTDSALTPATIATAAVAATDDCAQEESSTVPDETSSERLERLKERRKKIEEDNKRKRELLAQTIAARKQQTNNEAEKLKAVQRELVSIETELSVDVRILMDAIQSASVEFAEAQKRYNRIEREFIAAKVDLQAKSERKELLMEHLSAIIEQNEVRKAEKLAKMMHDLGLGGL